MVLMVALVVVQTEEARRGLVLELRDRVIMVAGVQGLTMLAVVAVRVLLAAML